MSADELIDELSVNHPKGFDLSLERISRLLEKLGNPQERIPPAIHVAGTNGKGSTIAFCRSVLEAGGYRVHVHTSPHLVNWHERYRLAGNLVEDAVLEDAIRRVARANADEPATVFELLSAVMFVLFSESDADYSLVEVGLGGRLDATNVIRRPLVCAIAPVSLDHQAYLGDTLEKIAGEKAGIIKSRIPVVCGPQQPAALEVIERASARQIAPLHVAGQDFVWSIEETGFVFQDENGLLDLPMPGLIGDHQQENAALAIAALRAAGIELAETAYSRGMTDVVWPGRYHRLPEGRIHKLFAEQGASPQLWIDGGHNPSAGRAIAAEVGRMQAAGLGECVLVCGMINTKDPSGFLEPFSGLNCRVAAVPVASSEAGQPPLALANIAIGVGMEAEVHDSVSSAVESVAATAPARETGQVLFCGSLYLAGEILSFNGTPPA